MRPGIALCGLLLATPVAAGTDIFELTSAERAALGSEVSALLLDEPEIVDHAMNPPDYGALASEDAASQDLELLEQLAPSILNGTMIALFVSDDCADCDRAAEELSSISKASGATFMLHDLSDPANRALADRLDLTEAPFYVMSDRILRGHMPRIVLERYLAP